MPNLIDLSGQRFGTFTVRGRALGAAGARSAYWAVVCDCGAETSQRGDFLKASKPRCLKCSVCAARGGRRVYRGSSFRSGPSLAEIIEANSEFVTECGCQLWTAGADTRGYGAIRLDGKKQGAHRASWISSNGPIPDGLWVLHRCDTPPCINPDHLFLGTPADNVADMIRKQRHRFGRRHLYR